MADPHSSAARSGHTRRLVWWILGGVVLVAAAFTAYLVVPVVMAEEAGSSGQSRVEGYPLEVLATGDDGRTRTLSVARDDGSSLDLSAIEEGDRIVVSGTGFDASSGIYVAVCKIPESVDLKPGPCLGGVPELDEESAGVEGDIQWAASNWINDDWAWKLFGARGYDDVEAGSFTAYLLIPPSADEFVDCTNVACGIFTRNDHTALDNRVQDLYLPVSFSE